jgi:hypothetical protein
LAYYQISNFWYNEETGNVFLNLVKDVDVSYDHLPEETGQDIYEAQIFLDGGLSLVGKVRPSSLDGTITGGVYGRSAGSPAAPVVNPIEDAPE